jgi:diguanylate cyclase (GGDEF)-like protein/PAS domain S-box-containing protein
MAAETGMQRAAAPARILLVEDDPDDAELIQAYLAAAGRDRAGVLHARSLADGLRLLGRHEIGLTLLDLDLPDSRGFGTIERLRAAATGPVIVISGNGHPSLVEEALRRRAYDVIPKNELDAPTLRRVLRLAAMHDEAGKTLRSTEGRYRALIENSAEALVLLDATGRVEYASASMRRVLGYDSHEAIGRYGLSFVHPEDRDLVQAAFVRLRAVPGASDVHRVRFPHRGGGVRLLECVIVNRLDDPDVAAIVCNYRDLTREEEHRARFDATFENAAVGLAHVDREGRILLTNRYLCEMLGYAREELVGRSVRELSHPEDLDAASPQREQLRAGEIDRFSVRKRYRRKDGATRWVQLSVSQQRDAEGRPQYEIAAFQDVTGMVRAEFAARRLWRMYAALSEANEAVLRTGSADALYRRVCEMLVQHGGLKLAAVRVVDPASSWADAVAYAGEPASYLAKVRVSVDPARSESRGPAALSLREGRTTVSNDYLAEPALAQWHLFAREAGIAATMAVPLRRGGRPIGLLMLYAAEADWFGPELVSLAERMAENVSFALDNIDREAGRAAAEAALRASEARFRNLTDLSSDWYWEQDAGLRFTQIGTDPASGVFGDPAAVLGKTRWELPVTPISCSWEEHRAALRSLRPFRDFEFSHTGADGKPRYVSTSGYPVFDEAGRFKGYRGIARDITAREQSEAALRRFRAALDISADSISLVDIDSMRIIDMNDAAGRNLGYEREELIGAELTKVIPGRTLDELRAAYERLIEAGTEEELVRMLHRRKDGALIPVEVTRRVLHTQEGRYIIGIARDLTERLRTEERLRASHERFQMVSRATNDVVWDWNLLTDEVWWSENFQNLFGYESREVGAYADAWTSRVHPEDVERVKSQINGAIAAGARAWSGEYRFRRKDGSYADVHDRGLLMRDGAGRAVRMIGAMMDVSERKRDERRMRVHAERQAALARFGQLALGRRGTEELYAAAASALRTEGVDAACVVDMFPERGEYLVRAAQGEGPHAAIGMTGRMAPESVWADIVRDNAARIAGRAYLASIPADAPWLAWLRGMASAVYAPVRDDEKPIAMLCLYAAAERAFGAEDVRFAEAVAHVLSTALQRQKAEQRLAHLAQFDPLTGLPNRSLLQDRLGQSMVQARRRQLHAGVLFVDLDRFKLVNDTLGHHLGDALIREVGQRLLAGVRPGDTVGRISGDEFAVVLADLARPDDAALVAQKILDALARPFDLGGNEAYVTASIGIAAFPEDAEDAETLLKHADMAMYRAKESARNGYCFFTAEMNARTVAKAQLNTDLRHAIERRELMLHFQPKVELSSGELRGLEALLRWNHPTRGMVGPDEFVPALEDSGLIVPVGEWVIAEACAQIRRWELAGIAPVPVAVNLSAKQFLRRDLDGVITRALACAGVPPRLLELEITESCLMDSPEEAVRALGALRESGLKISVDDFGTGYSSLAYLARFPLSALKIDRAFVRHVHREANAAAIVRAVIDMANNLGLLVVAEGVETEEQAAFLRRHGCHLGQGYLFSRPLPAAEIAARLAAPAP